MRVIGEVPHPNFKITLFHWNEKYLVKFENGPIEQTYKVDAWDLTSEDDLKSLLNDDFIKSVTEQFEAMAKSWYENLGKHV